MRAIRIGVFGVLLAINLASIVPFYTTWQRWTLTEPLRSLAGEIEPGEGFSCRRPLWACLIFFYLPDCDIVWTLPENPGARSPKRPNSEILASGRSDPFRCATGRFDPRHRGGRGLRRSATRRNRGFRYFGETWWLQRTHERWPSCVSERPIRVPGTGGWHPWNQSGSR
ncbi:MAG: hypothetical protein R3E12_18775 [Candidatus Eisenbacteria bacterium]